ncbi:NapC/NirT family cytochrome c [Neobacillus sp. PS3-40]|uniref:cytochrome c3 family protein n=1 Tax=Neobacillus sp. PS3-40 TaxID=3070679 RepID=UPI0027E010A4|nr:NapC/NirT family cytochrome c [Neobacillus sp. PS3-40]WML46052.1 NapC/NirT family cytochrome c [Neobacillus sp. PS3-40]
MALWGKGKNKDTEIETREGRRVGLIRKSWRKFKNIDWKNPVNRWKFLFASLVVCIIVFGGGYGVLSFTNSPSFCSSCHEMAPEYSTYTASSHNEISCVQCHIKPGFTNMITHKMKSMKEVYYHVTGVPKQIVQTEEEAVANENCLQCHSKNRLVTASGDLKVNHKGHIGKDIPCITCHAGVVHSKIAARGINIDKDRGEWTKANAEKLIEEKYLRPNMGTCIDCHDKVNKGEEPWKEASYSVLPNPEETKTEAKGSTEVATTEAQDPEAAKAAQDQKTQGIILQAIGKEKANVKISMECTTCHKKVKVPQTHKTADWDHNHGGTAINKLNTCVNCHQDSKWAKAIPQEDIMSILKMGTKKVKYTPNIAVVKDQARINKFCSACHSKRPPGHENSEQWLTDHAKHAPSDAAKSQCFVCHDKEKPLPGSTQIKAPTDVYCKYCHRTGFKTDKKN